MARVDEAQGTERDTTGNLALIKIIEAITTENPAWRRRRERGIEQAVTFGRTSFATPEDPIGTSPEILPLLGKLEFLVVQDIFLTETAKQADVVLPAASFTERTGTFTNLERRLRHIDAAEEPSGEARPDWRIIQALAGEMGAAMDYASSGDILKEMR